MTTLRPFGPSVIFTALLRISTPRRMRSRASVEKRMSLAAIVIQLLKRETACEDPSGQSTMPRMSLSFMMSSSSPSILTSVPDHFPKRMRSPALTSRGVSLPVSSRPPGPTAMILTILRLLLDGIGDDDSAFGLLFTLEALDHDAVVQGSKCHVASFLFWAGGFAEQDGRALCAPPRVW